jgi:putative endonuclease
MDRQFYVYVVAGKRNGTLYVGVTSALVQRVWQHETKAVEGFSTRYGVDPLVYLEAHADAVRAIAREKQLKKWRRAWKIVRPRCAAPATSAGGRRGAPRKPDR